MSAVFEGAAAFPEPATSVICTVRDGVRHVEAALRSALATEAAQVIVVDDGSRDGTAGVLRRLAGECRRLRVIQAAHPGRGAALAEAFEAATTPFVMNLDADDVVHPDWVGLGSALLESSPDVAVVAPSARYLEEDGTVSWPGAPASLYARDVTRDLTVLNPLTHSGAIMRRMAVAAAGGYDRALCTHFDYDLWIRLAGGGWRLERVDGRLVCKRLHAGQKFEHSARLAYISASARVQARAIRVLHAGAWAWCLLVGRLCWGLLPRWLRMGVRQFLARASMR